MELFHAGTIQVVKSYNITDIGRMMIIFAKKIALNETTSQKSYYIARQFFF